MSLFNIFNVSGSAMSAQAQRLNVVASNLANADSATSATGQAYRAKQVVFEAVPTEGGGTGVRCSRWSRTLAAEAGVRPEASDGRRQGLCDDAQRERGRRDGQHAVGLAFLPDQRRNHERGQDPAAQNPDPRSVTRFRAPCPPFNSASFRYASQDLLNAVNPRPRPTADRSVEADTGQVHDLLVTQLKNQDPLNPLDNAQITSQLAQLSTVTGVNKLNDDAGIAEVQLPVVRGDAAATNMIGHGVLVEGGNVTLTGTARASWASTWPARPTMCRSSSPIRSTGKDVQTIDLGAQQAGTVPLAWDGVPDKADADGKPTAGRRQVHFRVVATAAASTLKDAKALSFDSVASVTTSAGGVKLNLPTSVSVTMADIKQVL
jgi:flagellar basal-body rod modification protein FlgD